MFREKQKRNTNIVHLNMKKWQKKKIKNQLCKQNVRILIKKQIVLQGTSDSLSWFGNSLELSVYMKNEFIFVIE